MKCPKCKQEMNLLTVKKEGANQGRKFWGCPDRSCNGFEWADSEQADSSSQTAKVMATPQAKKAVDWDKKDELHARQTAANVGSTILSAMIEAKLYDPVDVDEAISKLKTVVDELTPKIYKDEN